MNFVDKGNNLQIELNCSKSKTCKMRPTLFRRLTRYRPTSVVDANTQGLTKLLDHKLEYINRSFEQNLQIQEIYLDLLKNKKTLRAKELKQYYVLFTGSKAQSLMFKHETGNNLEDNELNKHNPSELLSSLKLLYCRLIEKIMLKISYYLMNENNLGLIIDYVSQMMKKCELIIRRVNCLKGMGSINQVLDKVYQQNQHIQSQIIGELINKGYIHSPEEFYRINGIDTKHSQFYQPNDQQNQHNEYKAYNPYNEYNRNSAHQQTAMKKNSKDKKSKIDYLGMTYKGNMYKEIKKMQQRAGAADIEARYKTLLIHLDRLMQTDQCQKIEEQSEEQNNDDDGQQAHLHSVQTQPPHKSPQIGDANADEICCTASVRDTHEAVMGSDVASNQLDQSQLESDVNQLLLTKKIKKLGRKHSSPFNESFVKAVRSINKQFATRNSSHLALKRMSQQLLSFDKPSSGAQSRPFSPKQQKDVRQSLRESKQKKSIMQLLSIYQNRTMEEEVDKIEEAYMESHQGDICQLKGLPQKFSYAAPSPPAEPTNKNKFKEQRPIKTSGFYKQLTKNNEKHSQQAFQEMKQDLEFKPIEQTPVEDVVQPLGKKAQENEKENQNTCKIINEQSTINNANFKIDILLSMRTPSTNRSLNLTNFLTKNGIQSLSITKQLLALKRNSHNSIRKTVPAFPRQTSANFAHFKVYDRIRRRKIR